MPRVVGVVCRYGDISPTTTVGQLIVVALILVALIVLPNQMSQLIALITMRPKCDTRGAGAACSRALRTNTCLDPAIHVHGGTGTAVPSGARARADRDTRCWWARDCSTTSCWRTSPWSFTTPIAGHRCDGVVVTTVECRAGEG